MMRGVETSLTEGIPEHFRLHDGITAGDEQLLDALISSDGFEIYIAIIRTKLWVDGDEIHQLFATNSIDHFKNIHPLKRGAGPLTNT